MGFSLFGIAVFFLAFLIIYWILRKAWRTIALLLASALFYCYWDWRFLFLLATSIAVDYYVGLRIGYLNSLGDSTKRLRHRYLVFSLSFQLLILGFFKYFNFFSESLYYLLSRFHISLTPSHLSILLPIGISFYTLKTMTYTLDIYYRRYEPTKSFLAYAAFIGFFPEILSGPIDRAKALLPQIIRGGLSRRENFQEGAHLIFWGLFKKIFVADSLFPHVQVLFSLSHPAGWQVLWGAIMFYFQLYADFSGYTDIASGCAKCLGFQLALNFNFPYLAKNPSDFWQRWHISLSTWLRDYIFLPLGGAFRTPAKAYRNLAITMLLAGLWHGASITFIVWGAYQGILLIGHRISQPRLKRWGRVTHRFFGKGLRRSFRIFVTFLLVSLGWVIFRAGSWPRLKALGLGLLQWERGFDLSPLIYVLFFAGPLILLEWMERSIFKTPLYRASHLPFWGKIIIYAVLFYLLAFSGATAQNFIYAQF